MDSNQPLSQNLNAKILKLIGLEVHDEPNKPTLSRVTIDIRAGKQTTIKVQYTPPITPNDVDEDVELEKKFVLTEVEA